MIRSNAAVCIYILVIALIHSTHAAAADDSRLRMLATQAWELELQMLRWGHYWQRKQLPVEYVRGGEIAITFFGASDGNSVGFCDRLTGYCSLYLQRGGTLKHAAGWRFKEDCGDICQASVFRQKYASAIAILPLGRRSPTAPADSSPKYFDPKDPRNEDTTSSPDVPDYSQILTMTFLLKPFNNGSSEPKQTPPDVNQLREWATKEARTYLASGCTDRVDVTIPFNFPKCEKIYVSFRRSAPCGNSVVLLDHYSDGWVRNLDLYDPPILHRMLLLIDANAMDRFHVTRNQVIR